MIYANGKIKIINITYDKNGLITETVGNEIDANIRDYNRIVVNNQGQEVVGLASIMIESDNVVNYGDKVLITKRFGLAYKLKDKKFIIQKLEELGGFSGMGIRITL